MTLQLQLRLLQAGFLALGAAFVLTSTGLGTWISEQVAGDPAAKIAENAMLEAGRDALASSEERRRALIVLPDPAPTIDSDRIQQVERQLAATRRVAEEARDRADAANARAEDAYRKAMEPCLIYREFC